MANFRFRFQSVLRQRQIAEDECQRELAKQLRGRMIFQNQLKDMQTTIRDAKQQLGASLVGKVNLDRIAGFARYSGQTTERARQLVYRLAEMEQRVEQARAQLLEATQRRKAMELLYEKHYQAWLRDQRRREAIELDELATQRHIRKAMEGVI